MTIYSGYPSHPNIPFLLSFSKSNQSFKFCTQFLCLKEGGPTLTSHLVPSVLQWGWSTCPSWAPWDVRQRTLPGMSGEEISSCFSGSHLEGSCLMPGSEHGCQQPRKPLIATLWIQGLKMKVMSGFREERGKMFLWNKMSLTVYKVSPKASPTWNMCYRGHQI